MSLVFVVIAKRKNIYWGEVHWRVLLNKEQLMKSLKRTRIDGGYIFVDKTTGEIIDNQSCIGVTKEML